jgi:hypothetical protein
MDLFFRVVPPLHLDFVGCGLLWWLKGLFRATFGMWIDSLLSVTATE